MSDTVLPPGAARTAGEERRVVTQRSLNDDILRLIDRPGPVWIAAFALDLVVLLIGALADRFGPVLALEIMGVCGLIGVGAVNLWWKRQRVAE